MLRTQSFPYRLLITFGAIRGNMALSWDDAQTIADKCGLPTVNVLAGLGEAHAVIKTATETADDTIEGFAIRPAAAFPFTKYGEHVGKWVGSHHKAVATSNG